MKKFLILLIAAVSFNTSATFLEYDFSGGYEQYSNQPNSGRIEISQGNSVLTMLGNNWALFEGPFVINSDTILEITFSSTLLGELQGIGFDDDTIFHSQDDFRLGRDRFFQFAGSQTFGIQEYNTYDTVGEVVNLSIEVGRFVTGTFNYLVFMNDQDISGLSSQSSFRNTSLANANANAVSEPGVLSLLLVSGLLIFSRKWLKK